MLQRRRVPCLLQQKHHKLHRLRRGEVLTSGFDMYTRGGSHGFSLTGVASKITNCDELLRSDAPFTLAVCVSLAFGNAERPCAPLLPSPCRSPLLTYFN